MKLLLAILVVAIFHKCYAPPVTQNKEKEPESQVDGLEDYMEYHRYLREVVNALESDPEFRQKLEKAQEEDIKSGKIAHELEFVSHNVRTQLDEIKRTELERLRQLMERKRQLQDNNEIEDPTHHHLDHNNPHTFEIEDLKKLIAKTTEDLAEADKKRRDEFKQYEMQKELDKQQKLNSTEGEEREKLEKQFQEQEEKHKKHAPLHEPGHKEQLEEVWEKQDQMQQEFNPKTFFLLHDLDSNGLWDQDEVKALFVKELDKMYAAGAPEDDMRERAEEMERMRETVFREVDMNRDGFIDYEEFLAQTRRNDFQQDNGWQGLDEQKPYTDDELAAYAQQQRLYYQQTGHQQPGYYQVPHQAYQVPAGGYHPNQIPQGYHPNQVPPVAYQGQPPSAGYYPNQVPQNQGQHPNVAVPNQAQAQGQFHPGQLAQNAPQQLHNQQVPPINTANVQGQHLPDLNTNEIYPHQQNQPQMQANQQQHNVQNVDSQRLQGQHPNQQYQGQQQPIQQQPIQQQPIQQQPIQQQPIQQQPIQQQPIQQQPQANQQPNKANVQYSNQPVYQQPQEPNPQQPQPVVSQNAQPSAMNNVQAVPPQNQPIKVQAVP